MYIQEELKSKVKFLLERQTATMAASIGMEYTSISQDKLVATMPVNEQTKQPFGLLHGGASVALAESLASVGAWLNVDEKKFNVVGVEINANHLRAVREGKVTGTATPLHKGRTTHVWEIKITTDDGKLVCISRCTLAVVAIQTK